ncbi:vWA domain-containing protein [Archangium primigenium]|uniref:vWA domain-containing protein n=1 Tax=[Archangium] primigenium TaxID=2792470 RepID=UPI001956352E|nr:VWA domain-containing protein [Archangium primigenium]MBM7114765.1 VWA domain-containing protein [Archangium primigenium]
MNKTVALVSLAATLAVAAVLWGLPRGPEPLPLPPPPVSTGSGALTMTARLSHPAILPGQNEVFVTVDVTGVEVPGATRSPVNLALVIDRSSSMSGYKLQQARQAARHLVGQLGPDDRLALVHYGSDVQSLPSLATTPANRERMLQYIDGIWDDGGTNIGAGLQTGRARVAEARTPNSINRLILLSDGQPTEGIVETADLTRLVRDIRAEGITVSAIGVGTDFNEDLMQGFAEYGAGAYGFLEDAGQLASLFQRDLRQASTSVARDVRLSFTLPEAVRLEEVLGYRVQQEGRQVTVSLPDFSSGQTERVVARVTVSAGSEGALDVSGVALAYQDLRAGAPARHDTRLQAHVTSRPQEVTARQDKDATVYATRALSAQNLERAAEAMSAGRREEAKGYVMQNQALFRRAGSVASPAAVAADLAEQEEVLRDYEGADDAETVGAAVKRTKTKSLKGFGRLGSTY